MSGIDWALMFMLDCLATAFKTIFGFILLGFIILIPAFTFNYFSKEE